MVKITKKENAAFISDCEKLLIKLGAEKIENHFRDFRFSISTRVGNLYLKIDDDNSHCYSLFGNFFGNEQKAKQAFGHWKYNYHGTGELSTVLLEIENHLKNTF